MWPDLPSSPWRLTSSCDRLLHCLVASSRCRQTRNVNSSACARRGLCSLSNLFNAATRSNHKVTNKGCQDYKLTVRRNSWQLSDRHRHLFFPSSTACLIAKCKKTNKTKLTNIASNKAFKRIGGGGLRKTRLSTPVSVFLHAVCQLN